MSTNQTDSPQGGDETSPHATDENQPQTASDSSPQKNDGPDDPQAKIEELTEKVEALEAERDELNEKVLRKAAEFENFRRRMDREKKRRHEAGMVEVIEPILEVLDDFERSLEAAQDLEENQEPTDAYESLKGGVEMVFRKFRDTLETLGVEPIEAEGRPFDESVHEAMMRQPSDEAEPGTVLQEIRTGYRMDDRVIRYSRVVVAAEPEQEAAEDDG